MNTISIGNDKLMVNNHQFVAKGQQEKSIKQKRGFIKTLEFWLLRSKHRRRLLELPDYLLNDIGLTREDVIREANKPFWENGIY